MGHRALVIYDILDRYAVAHSHWGAQDLRLEDRITADALRGGSYPEQGLIEAVADGMVESDDADIEETVHIGGNDGDVEVDIPFALMEKPCSIGDVLAQHGGAMYEAVYIVDVDFGRWRGTHLPDEFEDLSRAVTDVDVTGYRTLSVSFHKVDDAQPDTTPALAPPMMLYRGSREAGNEAVHDLWALEEAAEEGAFDADSVAELGVQRAVNTIHEDGGHIPEFSPVGGNIEPASLTGRVRRSIRQHRNGETDHHPESTSPVGRLRGFLAAALPV